jgi:hypothetical protein
METILTMNKTRIVIGICYRGWFPLADETQRPGNFDDLVLDEIGAAYKIYDEEMDSCVFIHTHSP